MADGFYRLYGGDYMSGSQVDIYSDLIPIRDASVAGNAKHKKISIYDFREALDLESFSGLNALSGHLQNFNNPHQVTKAQVGLGNVDNTSDLNKPISIYVQSGLNLKADLSAFNGHTGDLNNPHGVTKVQVGLGNVDNTSDLNKPISAAVQSGLNSKFDAYPGLSFSGDSLIAPSFLGSSYKMNVSGISLKTGNFTFASGDNGKIVSVYGSGIIVATVPNNLPSLFFCMVSQEFSGLLNFTGAGTTLQSYGAAYSMAGQYASATLWQKSTALYRLDGNIL